MHVQDRSGTNRLFAVSAVILDDRKNDQVVKRTSVDGTIQANRTHDTYHGRSWR